LRTVQRDRPCDVVRRKLSEPCAELLCSAAGVAAHEGELPADLGDGVAVRGLDRALERRDRSRAVAADLDRWLRRREDEEANGV